jgi:hypothetical protein
MISNNDFICTNYVKFIRNTTYNKFIFYFLLLAFPKHCIMMTIGSRAQGATSGEGREIS